MTDMTEIERLVDEYGQFQEDLGSALESRNRPLAESARDNSNEAHAALLAAIRDAVGEGQEPIAWMYQSDGGEWRLTFNDPTGSRANIKPLCLAPQPVRARDVGTAANPIICPSCGSNHIDCETCGHGFNK